MGILDLLRLQSSVNDVKDCSFYKALCGEFLGTGFLLYIGMASTVYGGSTPASIICIALAFGLAVGLGVYIVGDISGGHINPSVTIGMLVTRKIGLLRAVLYMICQVLGAVAGTALFYWIVLDAGTPGLTQLRPQLNTARGFFIEFFVAFILILVIFAVVDANKVGINGLAPLLIGLTVFVCHVCYIPYTGCSMNPARSTGPAIIYGNGKDLWLYWVASLLGGMSAGLLYELVLQKNASFSNLKDWLLSPEYPKSENAYTPAEEQQELKESA